MLKRVLESPEIWVIEIPLPDNPLRSINSYIVRSGQHALIVDTAFNHGRCREVMHMAIEQLKLDLQHSKLFLTHLHADHIGLTEYYVEHGSTVYMSEIDYHYFQKVKNCNLWGQMQEIFCQEGFPQEEMRLQAPSNHGWIYDPGTLFPATKVNDGDRIMVGDIEAVCIHTPGHTPGHMMLYLPQERILFSGDHILFDITPNINIWKDIASPLEDYLSSLEKAKSIPVRLTLPGHRNYIGDLNERIDVLIAHHKERLHEISMVVKRDGLQNGYTIATKISWSVRDLSWGEFPPNQKWFATGETLAHLHYLVRDGAISRIERDGMFYYDYIEEAGG